MAVLEGINRFCFGASYAAALALELARLYWPRPLLRPLALAFGVAGFVAHSLYVLVQRPELSSPAGSLLLLAWVLAVFYLYGAVHYRRLAWSVFVLPPLIGVVALADRLARHGGQPAGLSWLRYLSGDHFWGATHGTLLLLAAVGVSVGFVASVMYLVQAARLRAKMLPNRGAKMLSLERLEEMNRRGINAAFPLLSAGLLLGVALTVSRHDLGSIWTAPKVLGTAGLWLLFLLLMMLRYSLHARGRLLAWGTIAAFVLLLGTLSATHPVAAGGGP